MRTGKIEISGKEYLLCFSARVVRDCAERYGDIKDIFSILTEAEETKQMDESFWLLAKMIDAGARYARLEGIENPAPLSQEDLYDIFGVDDLLDMKTKIMDTVTNGNEREIETEPEKGKNGETTRQISASSGTSGMD